MAWFSFHGGHSGEFCCHAQGRLEDVLEAAVRAGFSSYGVSEHAPKQRDADLYEDEAGLTAADTQDRFRAYAACAFELRDAFADRLEVLVGFETDAVPPDRYGEWMASLRAQAPFDYVVGSVHHVADFPIDVSEELYWRAADAYGGPRALERAYFERLAQLVGELRPEVVGHLDLIRWIQGQNPELDREVWPWVERVLEAALDTGALLDVNTSPLRKGFGPIYPLPPILERARELGVRVTLGDDSHGPGQVGVGLEQGVRAIAAAGFRELWCLRRRDGAVLAEAVPLDQVRPAPPASG